MPFVKLHTVKTEELINEVFPNWESLRAQACQPAAQWWLSPGASAGTAIPGHLQPRSLLPGAPSKLRAHWAAWLASGQKHHIEHTNTPQWATCQLFPSVSQAVWVLQVYGSFSFRHTAWKTSGLAHYTYYIPSRSSINWSNLPAVFLRQGSLHHLGNTRFPLWSRWDNVIWFQEYNAACGTLSSMQKSLERPFVPLVYDIPK